MLRGYRLAIDLIDDAMIDALALRQRVVSSLAQYKHRRDIPLRDTERESAVLERSMHRAKRWGVEPAAASQLMRTAIDCSVARQRRMEWPSRTEAHHDEPKRSSLLGFLPPPRRFVPLLRAVPEAWQRRLLETTTRRVLQAPLAQGQLGFLEQRKLAIEITDLDLRWVLTVRNGCLECADNNDASDASVRGHATDFLLLAGRLEDADTLFFQRRLALTGDTELGLTARNVLDQLRWEEVPLALRISLHRMATLATRARAAYRSRTGRLAERRPRVSESNVQ